jgi:hypothetical protein
MIAAGGCTHAPTLVGVWRAQDSKATIEFLKDGSWKMAGATVTVSSNQVAVPMSGTYKVADSNHIVMGVGMFGEKSPITLIYSLSDDTLDLQTFNLDGEVKKYRRIKNQ